MTFPRGRNRVRTADNATSSATDARTRNVRACVRARGRELIGAIMIVTVHPGSRAI